MSVPAVLTNELDNQIGVSTSGDDIPAIVGTSSSGTVNTPVTYTRVKDVTDALGTGPLCEGAAYVIENLGKPVLLCKTGVTTVGGYATIDVTGVTGTSVATTNTATEPYDDYDVVITIVTGGTIGVAGITYTWSLDGGRTTSPITALGTAVFILISAGNARVNFAAGTLLTNDVVRVRTSAPLWNGAQLASAFTALGQSVKPWSVALVMGNAAAADVATVETSLASIAALGKKRTAIMQARRPAVSESDATYQASLVAAFSATSATSTVVCAGEAKTQSPISQRRYGRPTGIAIASRIFAIGEHEDPAAVKRGPLASAIQIVDSNGNQENHNELYQPGLDDARFATLRTWEGRQGVYINNARLMSPTGSDFQFVQHRRVLNLADYTVRQVLMNYASDDILVDPTSGFILEEEARGIEIDVLAALDTILVEPKKVSAITFAMSRSDNLLSTFTLKGALRIVPLAYPKTILIDVGFYNPALRLVAAPQ